METWMTDRQWNALREMANKGYRWGGFKFEWGQGDWIVLSCKWDIEFIKTYKEGDVLSDKERTELRRLYKKFLEVRNYL